ncbi:MAG: response regulator [Flavonifractor plautii]
MADASEEFRRVFTGALEEESGLELAAETGDGQETVRLAKELSPDIVVMDFVLARMDGLEVLSELAALPGRPGCWCSPALRGAIWRSWPRPMARTTI